MSVSLSLLLVALAGPLAAQGHVPPGPLTPLPPGVLGAGRAPAGPFAAPPAVLDPLGGPPPLESGVIVGLHGADAVATGPGYGAVFTATGVRFLPGPPEGAVPEEPQGGIFLAPHSVGRGKLLDPIEAGTPTVHGDPGNEVRYARAGFVEVWRALASGLKQSFVFPTPPNGKGDLVVRLLVGTGYLVSEAGPDGVTFADGRQDVARIGRVKGIDANGWTVDGELKLDQGRLDLVLPEAFVEQAAYPIVLDPPITSLRDVPASGFADTTPDVSWDADTGRFCLVWERRYASGTRAQLAQVFEGVGTPVLPLAFLGWTFRDGPTPVVCSVNSEDLFVAVHAQQGADVGRLVLTGIRATDLRMTKTYEPAPGYVSFDAGGDPHESSRDVVVVWNAVNGIFAREFVAEAEGIVPNDGVFTVEIGPTDDFHLPRISQSCGTTGRWLACWENRGLSSTTVRLAVIERGGGVPATWLLPVSEIREPTVDGDGQVWLLAGVVDTGHEIRAYRLEYDFNGFTFLPTVIQEQPSFTLLAPEVAYTPTSFGPAYTVAWRQASLGPWSTLEYLTLSEDLLTFLPKTTVASAVRGARIAGRQAADFDGPPTDVFALAIERVAELQYQVATP